MAQSALSRCLDCRHVDRCVSTGIREGTLGFSASGASKKQAVRERVSAPRSRDNPLVMPSRFAGDVREVNVVA